jgi:hypothetical protein
MSTWLHKIIGGAGGALVVVGFHIPGPIGWIVMGVGYGIGIATDRASFLAPPWRK